MTDLTKTAPKSAIARYLPLIAIVIVATIGFFTLRDYLSFDALRENREMLIAFKDNNYLLTVLIFMACCDCGIFPARSNHRHADRRFFVFDLSRRIVQRTGRDNRRRSDFPCCQMGFGRAAGRQDGSI